MASLTSPVYINSKRTYWLSSITGDVSHNTIQCQEIDANLGRFSTVYVSDFLQTSTLQASTFSLNYLDLSEANISTLKTNSAYTSTLYWASGDLSGTGQVKITTDPSGVSVDGDPIVFNNLVYFQSTITLVPVSTIVDTDILAQRGFFSTLSSGSISTGNLRADTASISSLTVSTILTQDISGFHPSDWSLYPTLNSSIQFQPAYVLSNVNNKLYFAGYDLTDASGGGQDWSYFPALQDVSMNNFSIRQLSTLQYNDGAKLYSQTGNNLFYNGQQISYGQGGAASNWSLYPALQNVNMNNFGLASGGNLPMVAASNITTTSQQFSTVVDQGINVASYADYNVTVQNGNKGRINLTANTGTQGLFGEINMTANGGTVAGVGTGGLITMTANTPVGTLCNATSAIKLSASGINSYAGAVPPIGSLAGYNFIYGTGGVNISAGLPAAFPNVPLTTYLYGTAGVTTSSDFYTPDVYPYWNGVTNPPDLLIAGRYIIPNLYQVYVQLSNVKYIYMGGAAQIQNAQLVSTVSTTASVGVINSLTSGTIATTNITVAQDITGTGANDRILNFSTINSFNVSTVDLRVSSINGQPIDISGGTFVNSDKFSTLFTSSILASTFTGSNLSISSITAGPGAGGTVHIDSISLPHTGGGLLNCVTLNTQPNLPLTIQGCNIILSTAPANNSIYIPNINSYSQSTFFTSSIKTPQVNASTVNLALSNSIVWDDGSMVNFTKANYQDVANNSMVAFTSNDTLTGCNSAPIAASGFYSAPGTGAFAAAKFYSVYPGDNWGIDIIDAGGATLFESINSYDTGGFSFQTNVYGVSSITGWLPNYPGATAAVGIDPLLTVPTTSTLALFVSSINGAPVDGGSFDNQFSTLYVSSLNFSTSFSYGSNTGTRYPIFIEQDHAGGNTSGDAVAIAVQGHNLATGAVRNQIEFGARGSGENYIMSVWPGQNLEDLFIDATQVTVRDSDGFSTIINENPYGVRTNGAIEVGSGSGVVTISTNNITVGIQTKLTKDTISTTFLNTPYGNNLYMAGQQQPCVFFGNDTFPSGGGTTSTLITLPTSYTNKDFSAQITYKDSVDNTEIYWSTQTANTFLAFGGSTHGFSWTTFGNLPFTG